MPNYELHVAVYAAEHDSKAIANNIRDIARREWDSNISVIRTKTAEGYFNYAIEGTFGMVNVGDTEQEAIAMDKSLRQCLNVSVTTTFRFIPDDPDEGMDEMWTFAEPAPRGEYVTVRDLIKQLADMPQDMEVVVPHPTHNYVGHVLATPPRLAIAHTSRARDGNDPEKRVFIIEGDYGQDSNCIYHEVVVLG